MGSECLQAWVDGITSIEDDRPDDALTCFLTASRNGGARLLYNMGLVFQIHELYDQAEDTFKTARMQDRYLAIAYVGEGLALLRKHSPGQHGAQNALTAAQCFEQAMAAMRGTLFIDYTQLGLGVRLFACEVLWNCAIANARAGQFERCAQVLEAAVMQLPQAVADQYQLISQWNSHVSGSRGNEGAQDLANLGDDSLYGLDRTKFFQPNPEKVKNIPKRHFITGKSKVVHASRMSDRWAGFSARNPNSREMEEPSGPKIEHLHIDQATTAVGGIAGIPPPGAGLPGSETTGTDQGGCYHEQEAKLGAVKKPQFTSIPSLSSAARSQQIAPAMPPPPMAQPLAAPMMQPPTPESVHSVPVATPKKKMSPAELQARLRAKQDRTKETPSAYGSVSGGKTGRVVFGGSAGTGIYGSTASIRSTSSSTLMATPSHDLATVPSVGSAKSIPPPVASSMPLPPPPQPTNAPTPPLPPAPLASAAPPAPPVSQKPAVNSANNQHERVASVIAERSPPPKRPNLPTRPSPPAAFTTSNPALSGFKRSSGDEDDDTGPPKPLLPSQIKAQQRSLNSSRESVGSVGSDELKEPTLAAKKSFHPRGESDSTIYEEMDAVVTKSSTSSSTSGPVLKLPPPRSSSAATALTKLPPPPPLCGTPPAVPETSNKPITDTQDSLSMHSVQSEENSSGSTKYRIKVKKEGGGVKVCAVSAALPWVEVQAILLKKFGLSSGTFSFMDEDDEVEVEDHGDYEYAVESMGNKLLFTLKN